MEKVILEYVHRIISLNKVEEDAFTSIIEFHQINKNEMLFQLGHVFDFILFILVLYKQNFF